MHIGCVTSETLLEPIGASRLQISRRRLDAASASHGSNSADGGLPTTLRSGVLTRKYTEYDRESRIG